MPVELTEREHRILDGEFGSAMQMAMSILTRMADIFGAPALLPIVGAHIDSTIYIGEAGLEYAERLANLGARVSVPTTLNVSGLDEHHWQDWAVPQDWAQASHRQMAAYQSMGTIPTWTCAPYQTEFKPSFGQQIAWGESNAIAFANSVIGARTERYPDLLDICCAITGRVPSFGLHLSENRAGQILLRLIDIPEAIQRDDSFYPVIGHLVGKIAQDRVPVIDGLTVRSTEDQLKRFGAAAASSGAVALFHMVGVTPEAPDINAAFQGHEPKHVVEIRMEHLRYARRELSTAEGDNLDMVVLGSPHFSLSEFRQLALLVRDKHRSENVQFLVTTSRTVALLADQAGYLRELERFGGRVTVDTCILATPMLPADVKTLMTNSGKYAYYAPGMLNTRVTFSSLEDCVRSAIAGRVVVSNGEWGDSAAVPLSVDLPDDDMHRWNRPGARQVNPGTVSGELLVANEPLSFWGGYDYKTGEIIDRRHPLSGSVASGKILSLPLTRGSSTTTAVLLESVKAGTAPAAIITTGADPFFALASIVADVMYRKPIPIVSITSEAYGRLKTGQHYSIE